MEVEQSFFGNQEEWKDFLYNFAVNKESADGDITIVSHFIFSDPSGYITLRIGRVTKHPITEEEKAERGLAIEIERFTFGSVELGKIRYKMFAGKTVWKGQTDDQDCFRWLEALADKVKKLELGGEPIISGKQKSLVGEETAVHLIPSGLINPALQNAQDVALHTTGETVRGEILNQTDAELFERSERLARIEEGQNPYQPVSGPIENGDGKMGETAVYPQITKTINKDGTFKAEYRQYEPFSARVLTDQFENWCNDYFTSSGQKGIHPSLEDADEDMRKWGQKAFAYVFEGCVVSFVIKIEEPEKLLITPVSRSQRTDKESRNEVLTLVEPQIMDLAAAAKKRFLSSHQGETAVSHPVKFKSVAHYLAQKFTNETMHGEGQIQSTNNEDSENLMENLDDGNVERQEQLRKAEEAHKYDVQVRTIELWEKLAPYLKKGLGDNFIIENMPIPESTLRDNKRKMKKKGYWTDKINTQP